MAKAKSKRARRPVYGQIRRMIDAETGEERLAMVAQHPIDRALMKERGYKNGDDVRLEIKKPRNAKFHRLAHAIGNLLRENVEAFRHLTGHDAIKQVQKESGVFCEPMEIDLGTLGKVTASVPRSIAFDEMEESEFTEFFAGVTDWIDQHYSSVMLDDVRAEYLEMVGGRQ